MRRESQTFDTPRLDFLSGQNLYLELGHGIHHEVAKGQVGYIVHTKEGWVAGVFKAVGFYDEKTFDTLREALDFAQEAK